MEVYKAICAVQGELSREGISKDRTNQQQGFKYRGIDDCYAALSPLLAKHNLCILPRITHKEVVERTNSKGTALFYTTVTAEFDVVSAVDSSKHTVSSFGEAMDSGDKSIGKAMSYAYKAMAFMLFAIPTEGDNDPDATSHEVKSKEVISAEPKKIPAVNNELLNEVSAHCFGNESAIDKMLKEVSHYTSDGKEYSFGLERLPTVSEKWAKTALTAFRKKIADSV